MLSRLNLAITMTVVLAMALAALLACAPAAPNAPTAAPTKPAAAPTSASAATTPAGGQSASATATGPSPAFANPTGTAKPKRGGTVVVGYASDASSYDPVIDITGWMLTEPMHIETLIDYSVTDFKTGKQEILPRLAESWQQVSPTEIVFKLRKGVKFHDGSDMTADVVKWSLDRMGSQKSQAKMLYNNIQAIEVVDPSTIRIKYKKPSGIQLINLTIGSAGTGVDGPCIISKAQVDKANGDESVMDKMVVGTGPMKMVEWKIGDNATFTRFDNYWKNGADGQKLPYLDGVKTRIIPDIAVQMAELKAGGIHITRVLQAADLPLIKGNPDLQYLDVAWSPSRWFWGVNREKPLFANNPKLRQAISYAVDKDSITKVQVGEAGSPSRFWGWIPAWPGYSETAMKEYKFDLAKANELVKESGLPTPININLVHEPPTWNRKTAEMIQAMVAKANINLTLDTIEKTAVRARIVKGDFEMHVWSWSPSADPAHFNRAWTCDGQANWGHICDPELDKCMYAGEEEIDPAKRAQIYQKCENILYELAYQGGTVNNDNIISYRKELKNFKMQIHSIDMSEAWFDK